MTTQSHIPEVDLAFLNAEFDRVAAMVTLAEAMRTGDTLAEDFAESFRAQTAVVEQARSAGVWAGLLHMAPREALDPLTRHDLDLMALALAPVARPSLGPRFQSLQPQLGQPWPGLALIEDLLILNGGAQIALMVDRLRPTAPLVALGFLRVEGATPNQTIRPAPRLIQVMLGRDAELSPPPGASLSDRRGNWDDLILPPDTLAQLGDFTAWVSAAATLSGTWGAPPLHGPLALFSGPSGTGKTFAAGVIAKALSDRTGTPWALYTLDLGRIMSKYVGETEANLNALLSALEGRRAILQVDEADGLLGKRGEVTDARDRYANLEVSHMLSRLEDHAGPVILTTNLRANVDTAFLRRFQLMVDFPAPDADARALLWQRLLPPRAPLAKDVDTTKLAEAVRLSGGSIRNAATYAAVLAAEGSGVIGLSQIARAVWAELNKDSRQIRTAELGFLAAYLEAKS
ncbi:ATP-binding protein [Tabrizicola sp.]|uniref:ATP-binding protein n=1 Tax=Tabrizicola sp. TaxID=2005166 RepID=UPI00286A048C|nr:ATP-binding protein [Tabrizicola sp.]